MSIESPLPLEEIKSAVFIRIKSLGDTVLFTPVLANFKRACPWARLSVVVDKGSAAVLADNPEIDEIIISPTGGAPARFLRYVIALRRQRCDLAMDFHGGPRGAIASLLSGARYRVGSHESGHSFAYNIRVPRVREVLNTKTSMIHTVAKNLAPLIMIGVPITSTATSVYVGAKERESLQAKLHSAGVMDDERLFLIHVGATKKRKEYPPEKLAAVLTGYVEKGSMRPVVIGSKDDAARWASIVTGIGAKARERLVSTVGHLTVPEVKAICERGSVFLGPDSGIMHIADSLGARCVALFGKTELRLWHPWQSTHIVMRPCTEVNCRSTCDHYRTREGCLALISEDAVLEAVLELEPL
ncbi:MAG: glycosyltransferase family 9 protein [Candidatus Coatesbacteria bacterium]|nr:glycosyltransferase family 9 protein [Candidatus Coatesbacteria bacterium]